VAIRRRRVVQRWSLIVSPLADGPYCRSLLITSPGVLGGAHAARPLWRAARRLQHPWYNGSCVALPGRHAHPLSREDRPGEALQDATFSSRCVARCIPWWQNHPACLWGARVVVDKEERTQ